MSVVPKLRKHLPDYWYEKQRKAIDHYISTRGQEVKHISRVDVKMNMYHDIVYAKNSIKNIIAIVTHDPYLFTFLGTPFSQYEEDESELFAYFRTQDHVKPDDLIVIEYKTLEQALDRDVYSVTIGKTFTYEQELHRKYKLTNFRGGKLIEVYSSEELDKVEEYVEGLPPGSPESIKRDVQVSPGGFSSDYENRIDPPTNYELVIDKKTGEVLGTKGVDIVTPEVPADVPFHHGYRDGDHPVAIETAVMAPEPVSETPYMPVEKIDRKPVDWTKEDPFETFKK
jgi:hypothetical protein